VLSGIVGVGPGVHLEAKVKDILNTIPAQEVTVKLDFSLLGLGWTALVRPP
jgi:hypothetical protein